MPGLYLHIPFCLQKCHYCNFYSIVTSPAAVQTFLADLKHEIQFESRNAYWRGLVFNTIYLGGGTPSILEPRQLNALLSRLRNAFQFAPEPEITLEVNPETVTASKLEAFRAIGINRLNIGVQSFRPAELTRLNRIHSDQQARWCLRAAKSAGFSNVGADLIFGIPGQSVAQWSQNLAQLLELEPEHISTYGLTLEPGTFLAREINAGRLTSVSEEVEREMYLHTIATLTASGFEHYEISNFARPGFRSRHNQIYWRNEAYLGLGPSAHSFAPPVRGWNVSDVREYHTKIAGGQRPVENQEILTREQQRLERVLLGFRRAEGIDLAEFRVEFGEDFLVRFKQKLAQMDFAPDVPGRTDGFFILENEHLRLTQAGLLVYNEICAQFA
jgi:oxygen-independent coproporphyrinogen-3 oxidase